MTRLILVRHGESNVTVQRIIGGPRTCTGLSDLGRQQAERLRDRWASTGEVEADVLIASQYPRAYETAQIVAPALGDLPIVRDDGWGEHEPGPVCDGMSYQAFVDTYPDLSSRWDVHDPFATTFPEGETVAAFQFRVGSTVRRTLDQHEGRIAGQTAQRDERLAAAAVAEAPSRFWGLGTLRVKESDRITTLVTGFRNLGIPAEEHADGYTIAGSGAPIGQIAANRATVVS